MSWNAVPWSLFCNLFFLCSLITPIDVIYQSLRHMEYYEGILFVTTNRVKVFDDAFLSRVHVALNFTELSQEAKEKIWLAFIKKMGLSAAPITADEISQLAAHSGDGRVIKNAAKTAHSLSVRNNEPVGYQQLRRMLEATRSQQ